jgi:hypothetical protein
VNAAEALVDAIEASHGLPVPTPLVLAVRIEEQLKRRGYVITQAVDEPVDECDGLGCTCCNVLSDLRAKAADAPCTDACWEDAP